MTTTPVVIAKTLADHIHDVVSTTSLTGIHEIADAVISRLSDDEMVEYFKEIVASRISLELSSRSPLVTGGSSFSAPPIPSGSGMGSSVPTTTTKPRRTSKPWSLGWAGAMVSSGNAGEWVKWPEFTIDMAQNCRERLEKRVATSQENIRKYKLIEATLSSNGVLKIDDLSEDARKELEDALVEIPTV